MADWPYNTSTWQKLRLAKLAADPMCEPCRVRGNATLANAVDHMTPVNAGGDPFPPLDGLMSMCERCHNEKTAANDRKHKKPFARKIKGVDAQGNPVDHSDGWHRGGGQNHEKRLSSGPMWENKIYLVSGSQVSDENDELGFS
ncbi:MULTISPECIES: HNH endonuclease [unclassified Rhizobium]|uniref:HNH endonuclease n=1 Tax=unclassified Rhizobium TaxID=2613769 RepID=UPI000A5BE364|nr:MULTISPECIES: HNH endonuclease [unclassified Rhizobium]